MKASSLARLRAAALLILWVERLAVVLWAPAALIAATFGLALIGAGFWLGALLPVAALAGFAWLLRRGLRGFRRPDPEQAERWLERVSLLPHQPLAVLRDAAAGQEGGPLWLAHLARARLAVERLRLRPPSPALAEADPFALRLAALLLLAAGVAIAGAEAPDRLATLVPSFRLGAPQAAPVLEAWIEPPAYTGQPPLFLARSTPRIEVPAGSKLTVSLSGGGRPTLSLAGHGTRFRRVAEGAWQAELILRQGGRLRIGSGFGTLARWKISVLPDTPPAIAWAGTPGRAGTTLETRLPWHVAQRWGVAELHAELRPDGHPALRPITVPVALPGTPKSAGGAALADLSADPYAGLPMRGVLRGRDVSGQAGTSAAVTFTLPARAFHDPLARAVIELRRRLALDPGRPGAAADDLDALGEVPDTRARRSGVFLNLAAAAALLRAQGQAGETEAEARLWTLALDLDGALPDAAERKLAAARDALRHALADRARGRITDAELAKKMEALRQALAQRLTDIAKRAFEKGELGKFDPQGRSFASPALDRMIRQMEAEARAGHFAEARRDMAALEDLLNKLNHAKVLSPEQAARAAAANKQARQMMGAAQDLARREAGLMDSGQQREPRPPPMPPPSEWGQDMPPPPPDLGKLEADEASRGADTRTERALEQALRALQQGLGQFGAKPAAGLNDAGREMSRAEQALRAGQDGAARGAEARAVEDLQRGGREMAQQMQAGSQLAITPGGGEGMDFGEGMGGPGAEGQRDPLGRRVPGSGGQVEDDGSVRVPTEMEIGRSRAIQQELRRRDSDRARPPSELDYIERLLKPY